MKLPEPTRDAVRRANRQRRLGPDAKCVLCGQTQLESLTPVRRTLLESHHAVGQANDSELMVPLCRNCHAILTERLEQYGADMRPPATVLDKVVAILRALAAFFLMLGDKLLEWATSLAALGASLDDRIPEWRALAKS